MGSHDPDPKLWRRPCLLLPLMFHCHAKCRTGEILRQSNSQVNSICKHSIHADLSTSTSKADLLSSLWTETTLKTLKLYDKLLLHLSHCRTVPWLPLKVPQTPIEEVLINIWQFFVVLLLTVLYKSVSIPFEHVMLLEHYHRSPICYCV